MKARISVRVFALFGRRLVWFYNLTGPVVLGMRNSMPVLPVLGWTRRHRLAQPQLVQFECGLLRVAVINALAPNLGVSRLIPVNSVTGVFCNSDVIGQRY
jgi:hypothetical protein